ncbi:DUF805 domain-containing protein [Streptomyces geranii]|uniref:DUF805 domain-containing protein n=1 Tax=Streptomyces geranii TaxID=2058923 RepID=UPI000D02E799|nr:DUF805 domain-containing protein [Streptomyces geranii]
MNYYVDMLKNYAVFSGRARRKQYWMAALVSIIISIVLTVIDNAIGVQLLSTVYSLAVVVPGLAITARRLHDTGRSAWWILIAFTLIGAIVLLVFVCLDSDPGDNQHGPNPKGIPFDGATAKL